MNIETVFRIYHRLQRGSPDLCEEIKITRDKEADLEIDPTAVTVKFVPKHKRELTPKEKSYLRTYCRMYNLTYEMNGKGEMLWYQEKMINSGNQKRGKT